MIAYRCDRCNGYYSSDENDNTSAIHVGKSNFLYSDSILPNSKKKYDLCPTCMSAFNCFISEYHNKEEI